MFERMVYKHSRIPSPLHRRLNTDRCRLPLSQHFLLVDDGKEVTEAGKFYGEIETRAKLEEKICEECRVASVQIVVQGGYGTFKTVENALTSGHQVRLLCWRRFMIVLTALLTSRAPSGPSHRRFGWSCPGDIRARHAAAQGS